jgi:hypothetical protein
MAETNETAAKTQHPLAVTRTERRTCGLGRKVTRHTLPNFVDALMLQFGQ